MRACCLTGYPPTKAPEGTLQQIDGVPCYVADAHSKKDDVTTPAIIMCPDAFGVSPHQKVLADDMNRQSGYPVVVVDYFLGTSMPHELLSKLLPVLAPRPPDSPKPSFFTRIINFLCAIGIVLCDLRTFVVFLFRHRKTPSKVPLVARVASQLKGNSKRPLGLVGYCYGGYFGFSFGQAANSLVDCVVIAHSKVTLADVAKLQTPTLFVCAHNDWAFPEKLIPQVDALLRSRSDFSEYKFRLRRYPGTYHGFAIRGDERNPNIQAAKTAALVDCVTFFQNIMGSSQEGKK